MATPQETRKKRLKNDYKEMCNIRGPIVQWKEITGQAPYVEAYNLTVNIKSIIGTGPDYRRKHVIKITTPETYPFSPPTVEMITKPQPFHPNWYANGRWCSGNWRISEGLGHFVIRMMRTLQFDPEITNADDPANREASIWYKSNHSCCLFPCDKQMLPDPTKIRFEIAPISKKRFRVHP